MYLSKQQGHSVSVKSVNTIASGLAPPYAGKEDCKHNFWGLCSKIAQTILCNCCHQQAAYSPWLPRHICASCVSYLRTVSLPSSVLSLFSISYTSLPFPPTSLHFKFTTRSFLLLLPRAESPISDQHYRHCLLMALVRIKLSQCLL